MNSKMILDVIMHASRIIYNPMMISDNWKRNNSTYRNTNFSGCRKLMQEKYASYEKKESLKNKKNLLVICFYQLKLN